MKVKKEVKEKCININKESDKPRESPTREYRGKEKTEIDIDLKKEDQERKLIIKREDKNGNKNRQK